MGPEAGAEAREELLFAEDRVCARRTASWGWAVVVVVHSVKCTQ